MGYRGIAARIKRLLAVFVAGLLLLAVVGLGSGVRIGQLFASYEVSSSDTDRTAEFAGAISDIRTYAFRYRLQPGTGNEEDIHRAVEAIEALWDRLRTESSLPPEALEMLAGAMSDIAAYSDAFDRLSEAEAALNAHRQQIVESGSTVDALLADLVSATQTLDFNSASISRVMRQGFLAANAAVSAFILSGDPDEAARAAEHVAGLRRGLDALTSSSPADGDLAQDLARISEQVDGYWSAFEGLTASRRARAAAGEELDSFGPRAAEVAASVLAGLRDEQAALGDTGLSTAKFTMSLLALASVGALAAAWLLAARTRRSIIDEIDAVVVDMSRLAGGDLDFEITGQDSETEIGAMSRAMAVFRTNAIENRERAAREHMAEAQRRRERQEQAEREALAEDESRRRQAAERKRTLEELATSIGGVVEAAARGDFSSRIAHSFDEPELETMARCIDGLLGSVEDGIRETSRVLGRMAEGSFDDRMAGAFTGAFAELQTNVNGTIAALSALVGDIAGASTSVEGQSARMNETAANLARRAEQQAASLEETTAAMREIASSVAKGADEADAVRSQADEAVTKADTAGREVGDAVAAMQEIKAASAEIEDIVSVIEGIAFQTNLLALNASVEAARAGSAGKGFAVVATEVRDLAQRSADASRNIKGLIEKSSLRIETGVSLVENTGASLAEVVETVRQMSRSMTAIACGARDQAAGVSEIQTAIATLDDLTQKNAQMADQTREDAATLASASGAMRDKIARFHIGSSEGREIDVAA